MRVLILILAIFCSSFVCRAQDSTFRQNEGAISSLRQKLQAPVLLPDSLTDSLRQDLAADTLLLLTNSTIDKTKGVAGREKIDSIRNVLHGGNRLPHVSDSLGARATKPIVAMKNEVDGFQMRTETYLAQKTDSLEMNLNKPIEKMNARISSVQQSLQEKVGTGTRSIDERANRVEGSIEQGIEKATDGAVKLPFQNLGMPEVKLPATQGGIPNVDIPDPHLPALNTDLPGAKSANTSLDMPDANIGLGQVNEKLGVSIPEVGRLTDVRNELGDVDSRLAGLQRYEEELSGLKNLDSATIEGAAERAEEKIMNLEQMKGVKEQTQVLTDKQAEYNALIQRYKDQKLMQAEIARKARNVVNEKVNQHIPDVKEGMSKLDKGKSSLKELFKTKNNGLAGKPIGQRLIPGLTLQTAKGEVFMIDFGLQLGYRITGRLRSGVAGVYRLGFDESYNAFVKSQDVYGGRFYSQFLIRKGVYIHAEYELLNSPDILSPSETRQYVSSGQFGLGKQFNISRKVKGHTLFLYRAEFKGELPDQSKVNLRLGFDLRTDRKKRKL